MNNPLSPRQLASIRETARAGNKIGAIKLYRDYTGAGLAEAKEAVERIDAGETSNATPAIEIPDTIVPERAAWIHEALFKGNKMEAIKLYREGTNCGLKESKEAVEKLEAKLRQESPERFAAKASGKSCFVILAAGGGLLAVAVASILLYRR